MKLYQFLKTIDTLSRQLEKGNTKTPSCNLRQKKKVRTLSNPHPVFRNHQVPEKKHEAKSRTRKSATPAALPPLINKMVVLKNGAIPTKSLNYSIISTIFYVTSTVNDQNRPAIKEHLYFFTGNLKREAQNVLMPAC